MSYSEDLRGLDLPLSRGGEVGLNLSNNENESNSNNSDNEFHNCNEINDSLRPQDEEFFYS